MEHTKYETEFNTEEERNNVEMCNFYPDWQNKSGLLDLPAKDSDQHSINCKSIVSFNLDEDEEMLGRRSSNFGTMSQFPSLFSVVSTGQFRDAIFIENPVISRILTSTSIQ